MKSDFSAARAHLEKAYHLLSGPDETSRKAREALDWLTEAILVAEHSRPAAEVIPFPDRKRAGGQRDN
jgi:hypothetical protein